MAPYVNLTGAPPMGGIFFNSTNTNSSNINSIFHPILSLFMVRDATQPQKYSDGGAHGALILVIVLPLFFILFGTIAILWKSIKTARAAKARRAERRAAHRAARRARSNRTSNTSHTSRTGTSRSGRTSYTSQSTRSNGIFEDGAPIFNEDPLHGMTPAYMGPQRPVGRDSRPLSDLPPNPHMSI